MPDLDLMQVRRGNPPPVGLFVWGIVLPIFISTNRPCLCLSGSVNIAVPGVMENWSCTSRQESRFSTPGKGRDGAWSGVCWFNSGYEMGFGGGWGWKRGVSKMLQWFGERETEAQRVMELIWDGAVGRTLGSIQGWSIRTQPGTGVIRALLLAPQHTLFFPYQLSPPISKFLLFSQG